MNKVKNGNKNWHENGGTWVNDGVWIKDSVNKQLLEYVKEMDEANPNMTLADYMKSIGLDKKIIIGMLKEVYKLS